jgi:hypothetical protein
MSQLCLAWVPSFPKPGSRLPLRLRHEVLRSRCAMWARKELWPLLLPLPLSFPFLPGSSRHLEPGHPSIVLHVFPSHHHAARLSTHLPRRHHHYGEIPRSNPQRRLSPGRPPVHARQPPREPCSSQANRLSILAQQVQGHDSSKTWARTSQWPRARRIFILLRSWSHSPRSPVNVHQGGTYPCSSLPLPIATPRSPASLDASQTTGHPMTTLKRLLATPIGQTLHAAPGGEDFNALRGGGAQRRNLASFALLCARIAAPRLVPSAGIIRVE